MELHKLKRKTSKLKSKRVGRGGKRGTTSGHGTKGQKSRAGSYVRPGFRGGDNRIWQLFPKQRGASKKPGSKKPHRKHRFFMIHRVKPFVVNLRDLAIFESGDTVSPKTLFEKGLIPGVKGKVKILGTGELKKKLVFEDVKLSKPVANKFAKSK